MTGVLTASRGWYPATTEFARCAGPAPGRACFEDAWIVVGYCSRCTECTRRRAALGASIGAHLIITTERTTMSNALPGRRFKTPAELDEPEQERIGRFGASDLIERDEYVTARRKAIEAGEGDDPARFVALLREEATALREAAAHKGADALDKLTPQDWLDRDAARRSGKEVKPEHGRAAGKLEQQAAELERRAGDLAEHIGGAETTVDEHLADIQRRRAHAA